MSAHGSVNELELTGLGDFPVPGLEGSRRGAVGRKVAWARAMEGQGLGTQAWDSMVLVLGTVLVAFIARVCAQMLGKITQSAQNFQELQTMASLSYF